MEEALIFGEEYSTEMYKSGRVTTLCMSDFRYKVLGFCNLIKMLYNKTTLGLLFFSPQTMTFV